MKKLLSIFLVIAMLVTTCTVSVSAVTYTDIAGHWAENEIEAWSDYGVISGYDGKFSPDRHITRGEFAVVLSRLMGYQKESSNIFSDLSDTFYTSYILKLYNAGVMQGYDGYIRPEASLTREEASVMICRALGINTADVMNRAFSDVADVSSWSNGYINAMVNSGLLNGTDGKLNPQKPITRAEVVKILDNATHPILKAGTFANVDTGKIVLIGAGDVTIKDSEFAGTVIVTQGVCEGNISFTNSKLESNIVIDNDRSAFIKVDNATVVDKEILNHKAFITTSSGGGGSSGGSSNGPASYGVSFLVNGQVTRSIRVKSGETIGIQMPADPSVDGYIFRGWKDSSTGNSVTAETVVTGAMIVEAILEADTGSGDTTGGTTTGGTTTGGTTTGGSDTDDPCETGHAYGEWEKENDEYHKKECAVCGDVVTEAHTFDAGVVTQEPTITEEGVMTYTCSVCGSTKTEAIEKLPDPATTTTITVGDISAKPGDEITIPVSISNNNNGVAEYPGLTGLTLNFTYNPDVLAYSDAAKGEALPDLELTKQGPYFTEGDIAFLWDGLEADSTNGEILLITFRVKDTATSGGHIVNVTVKTACDFDMANVPVATKSGTVSIAGPEKPPHEHEYGDWEKEDSDNHKKTCGCGDVIREAHTWDDGVITTPPTESGNGIKTYTCLVCAGTKTENASWPGDIIYPSLPTIRSEYIFTHPGKEVTVPVKILDNVGLTGLEISVSYDSEALTLIGCETGEALSSLTFTMSGDIALNPITFLWDGTDADAGNGNILLLKFKVADTASAGEYVIDITVNSACDADINDVFIHTVDGKLCVLENIKVTFYEGYGRFAPVIDEVELNLNTYGQATVSKEDIPSESFPWNGYAKSEYMPDSYEDYEGKYEVEPDFWYLENGEWERFDETVVLREDTNVYWMYKELSVNAFGTAVAVRYDERSRAVDTVKAFLDKAIPQLEAAKNAGIQMYEDITDSILGMLQDTGLVDDEKYINKIKVELDFVDALTEAQSATSIINSNGEFDVITENLDILKAIRAELQNITFDAVLEANGGSGIDAMISLVGYDICKNIFDVVRADYFTKLTNIIDDVENGTVPSGTISSVFAMMFDPIDDIFKPLFDEAEEKAISEFTESVGYTDNPYLQYIVEDIDIFDKLLTGDGVETYDRTQYQLKDLITCFEFVTELLIAADDALCWYGDISDSGYEKVADAILAETKAVYGKFKVVLNDPAYSDKIPAEIKTAFECIEQAKDMISGINPTLKENIGDYINLETEAVLNELINYGHVNLRELIESGELYTKIDAFKNSPMGQKVDEAFINDIVEVIENLAEHGLDYYRVQTTDETIIDKYEIEIGGKTFSMSRYFVF